MLEVFNNIFYVGIFFTYLDGLSGIYGIGIWDAVFGKWCTLGMVKTCGCLMAASSTTSHIWAHQCKWCGGDFVWLDWFWLFDVCRPGGELNNFEAWSVDLLDQAEDR